MIAKGAFGDVLRVQRVGDQAGFAMKVRKITLNLEPR